MDYKVTEAVDEAKRVLETHYRKKYEQSVLVTVSKAEQKLQQTLDAQMNQMRYADVCVCGGGVEGGGGGSVVVSLCSLEHWLRCLWVV